MAENGSIGALQKRAFGKFGNFSTEIRAVGSVGVRFFSTRSVESQGFELAIKRRAADLEPPSDFRHLPTIVRDGEADRLGFDFFEGPRVALPVDQAKHVSGKRLLIALRPGNRRLQ